MGTQLPRYLNTLFTCVDVIQGTESGAVRSCLQESMPALPFQQAIRKFGANTVTQESNFTPINYDIAAADPECSMQPDGTGIPDDDSDSEAALRPTLSASDARLGQDMALSSEAIVQWMRGCTPGSSECHCGTSTDSRSTSASSIQASTSFSALSMAVSFKSQPVGERAQLLLDKSISAVASLRHTMETSEYVMLVQLSGASGVCRAVAKSLANLASKCGQSAMVH